MLSGKILILGGTAFIGRAFTEAVVASTRLEAVLLNRGLTNPELFPDVSRIVCDRDDEESCKSALQGSEWDFAVDFSGHHHNHICNIVNHCRIDHYTYLSSSAVDLSSPEDPFYDMALKKLWCEHLLQKSVERVLLVRSGFVVGKHDYTGRFELNNEIWVWKGTQNPVRPLVKVELLVQLLLTLLKCRHTGVAKCGYH